MMPVRRLYLSFLPAIFLLVAAGPVVAAEVYRWVDDEGVTHYTSTPPPDRDADKVDASNPPADDPETRRKEIEDLSESNKVHIYKKRLEREAAERRENELAQRRAHCNRLRDQRQTLLTSPQVREHGEDGPRVLSQEERERKLEEIERRIEERCGQG